MISPSDVELTLKKIAVLNCSIVADKIPFVHQVFVLRSPDVIVKNTSF